MQHSIQREAEQLTRRHTEVMKQTATHVKIVSRADLMKNFN